MSNILQGPEIQTVEDKGMCEYGTSVCFASRYCNDAFLKSMRTSDNR
jgi:hypothetical protein